MGGGGFASGERLNLNFRKSKENVGPKKEKSEKSPEQNSYLAKNLTSKKSEKSSHEKNLKFLKIDLRNFQKNRNLKIFQKFLARKNLLKKFLKQKFYRLKFFQKFHSRFFENSNHGTILIEFAFCVPVLILLLFYIHDVLLLHQMKDKMHHSIYMIAQLLQNVSVNRSDKRLTQKDLQQITYASSINYFCGKNLFYPYPLGIRYEVYYEYVKRVSENQYTYFVRYVIPGTKSASPNSMQVGHPSPKSGTKTLAELKAIYSFAPSLVCKKDGEERVRLHINYYPMSISSVYFSDFFLIHQYKTKSTWLVFTPKNGIFPVQ